MFYQHQSHQAKLLYREYLALVGSLSKLFSDSETPYLYYRSAERIFCRAFEAVDLSRSDISIDAKFNTLGIGLKTFLDNSKGTFQKVAEFNKESVLFDGCSEKDLIHEVSRLRNERLSVSQEIASVNEIIYHCVTRSQNEFMIFEEDMSYVDLERIKIVKSLPTSIHFTDGIHEYSFLKSKNTLTKKFYFENPIDRLPITILNDPLDLLSEKLILPTSAFGRQQYQATIYLPLYGKDRVVFPKSGLNQWNAGGRSRDVNEVYIPIHSIIHKLFPDFFPSRDTPFLLTLPNRTTIEVKICQDGGKALMSKSNKVLGKWILRDILKLEEGQILTYNKLRTIGIDSVRIDKIDDTHFEINFSKLDSYEDFINNHLAV